MATAGGGVTTPVETLQPRWDGPIIVAAAGPSLSKEVASTCRESGRPIVAVKQAAVRLPFANVVYACNDWQWDQWQGFPEFQGERWSCHHAGVDPKLMIAARYKLRLVRGDGFRATKFSEDPSVVHYGMCSGFAAVGFAIHWLRKPGRIVMVGFDFQERGNKRYFNGPPPRGGTGRIETYKHYFEEAAKSLPQGVEIVNATETSALKCFPMLPLSEALGLKAAA